MSLPKWKDRRIERENTFNVLNNKDGTITLIPVTGEIYEAGTPLNALNLNKINEQLETIETNSATKQELDVERKRMDSFTKLAEGSTTGDAELIDGRSGADGITYENIGGAIRGQNLTKIGYENINSPFKKTFIKNSIEVVKVFNSGFYTSSFQFYETGGSYAIIDVINGDEYDIEIKKNWNNPAYFFLYNDGIKNNVLYYEPSNIDNEIIKRTIKIPYGCNKLLIQSELITTCKITKVDSYSVSGIKTKQIKDKQITIPKLSDNIQSIFESGYRQLTDIVWKDGYYIDDYAKEVTASGYAYTCIEVNEGDIFKINGYRGWGCACYLVTNDAKKVLLGDGLLTDKETAVVETVITIPQGGTKLYLNNYRFKRIEKKDKLIVSSSKSNLFNKIIGFNGDSICQGVVNGGGYSKIIKDLTGCIVENRAIGGGTLALKNGTNNHKICDDIVNMRDDLDILCLEGGINDYWGNIPLGTLTPKNDFVGVVDKNTIVGAMEYIFRTALTKWNGIPIVFIITHPIQETRFTANQAGYTFEQQADKMKEVCRKYSVKYIDLLNESCGFLCNILEISKRYTTNNDGCHPNELAYHKFYVPQIKQILEGIII